MIEHETRVRHQSECPKVIRGVYEAEQSSDVTLRPKEVPREREQEQESMEYCSILESLNSSDFSSDATNSSTFSLGSNSSSNFSSLAVTPSSSPINDSVMISIDLNHDTPSDHTCINIGNDSNYTFGEKEEVEFLDLDRCSRSSALSEGTMDQYFALTFMSLPPGRV